MNRPAASPRRADADQIAAIASAVQAFQRLRASRQVHQALVAATGLDLPQQATQVLVALDGTMPVAHVARAASMDVGAVSRQITLLEEGGYVARSASPDNGSVVLVAATPDGLAARAHIVATRHAHLTEALAEWSPDDRRTLAALLTRFVDDLQATPLHRG